MNALVVDVFSSVVVKGICFGVTHDGKIGIMLDININVVSVIGVVFII